MNIRKALHLLAMKAKLQTLLRARTRPILLGFSLLVVVLLLVLRSNLSPTPLNQRTATQAAEAEAGAASSASPCAKLPASVADAIVHYATSNVTPQQTLEEISVTARVLARKSPCNFLVFGLGHDSPMWSALNHGGRTVFLEEDTAWIATVREKHPVLEAYHVAYDTHVSDEPCFYRKKKKKRGNKECSSRRSKKKKREEKKISPAGIIRRRRARRKK